MPYADPEKQKAYQHEHYLRNKEKLIRRQRAVREWARKQGYKYKVDGRRSKPGVKWIICEACGKEFFVKKSVWKAQRQRWCSEACVPSHGGKLRVRKPGWSDEQWEWEQKLSAMGLGENAGAIPDARQLFDPDGA